MFSSKSHVFYHKKTENWVTVSVKLRQAYLMFQSSPVLLTHFTEYSQHWAHDVTSALHGNDRLQCFGKH